MNADLNRRPEGTDRPESKSPERPRGLAEPGRHLTNAPVDRFPWSAVELDPPEWTKGVDNLSDLPTGEQLAEPDDAKKSCSDRLGKAAYDNLEDITDRIKEGTNAAFDLFGPRPTGQVETRVPSGPAVSEAHHPGVDAGSAASAVLAVGIFAAELLRRGLERMRRSEQV